MDIGNSIQSLKDSIRPEPARLQRWMRVTTVTRLVDSLVCAAGGGDVTVLPSLDDDIREGTVHRGERDGVIAFHALLWG